MRLVLIWPAKMPRREPRGKRAIPSSVRPLGAVAYARCQRRDERRDVSVWRTFRDAAQQPTPQ
jgi:hypothetical protein